MTVEQSLSSLAPAVWSPTAQVPRHPDFTTEPPIQAFTQSRTAASGQRSQLDPPADPWLRSGVLRNTPHSLCCGILFALVLASAPSYADPTTDAEQNAQSQAEEFSKLSQAELAVAGPPLKAATEARARAAEYRLGGHNDKATRAEQIAAAWTSLARDLLRAMQAEHRANELQQETLDLKQQVSRARALLEESLARVGRAKTALQRLDEQLSPPITKESK